MIDRNTQSNSLNVIASPVPLADVHQQLQHQCSLMELDSLRLSPFDVDNADVCWTILQELKQAYNIFNGMGFGVSFGLHRVSLNMGTSDLQSSGLASIGTNRQDTKVYSITVLNNTLGFDLKQVLCYNKPNHLVGLCMHTKDTIHSAIYYLHRYLPVTDDADKLETATYWLHFEDVEYNSVGQNGITPLLAACSHGSMAALDALMKLGADPQGQDAQGNTMMHYAFGMQGELDGQGGDNEKVVQWCLQNGFDINVKNHLGQTPLFFMWDAMSDIDTDPNDLKIEYAENIINMFKKYGGDIKAVDNNGQMFMDILPVDYPGSDVFLSLRAQYQRKALREEVSAAADAKEITANKKI